MIVLNNATHVKNLSGGLILMPGVNDVPPDAWKRLSRVADGKKMHPQVQHWIDEGELTVEDEDAEQMQDLADLSVKAAVSLVGKTLSLDLLNLWSEGEERSGVVKALKAQIKLVEPKAKADDEAAQD